MTDTLAARVDAERPRLLRLATRLLADPQEAEDVVQQAWLRLAGGEPSRSDEVRDLPAWLTTTVTRLCLDRLRADRSVPSETVEPELHAPDPADELELAETVGVALHVVLDRLTPSERVAFVLHDTFGYPHALVARVLKTTEAAARQHASRARRKARVADDPGVHADWEVVDAFLSAAREGELGRLLSLLDPEALVCGDEAAAALGTPTLIQGRDGVAGFMNGGAASAVPTLLDGRPGAAWSLRGELKVAFDFTVADARVTRIDFRADPDVLARLQRRRGSEPYSPVA